MTDSSTDDSPTPEPSPREPRIELDARGRERPRFLLNFPKDPQLQELCRAFESGDFARVRREAPKLAERTPDPQVKAAAEELRRRIDPDPLVYILLAMAFGLLVFMVGWTYLNH